MATAKDIAQTVGEFRDELVRRIEWLQQDRDLTESGAACLEGLVEWAGSIKTALEECDGVPTPTPQERFAAWQAEQAARANDPPPEPATPTPKRKPKRK